MKVLITSGEHKGRSGLIQEQLTTKQVKVLLLRDRSGKKEQYEVFNREDLKEV